MRIKFLVLLVVDITMDSKKRNIHKIVSKKEEKFKLKRSNWANYHDFASTCSNIANKMVEVGLAIKSDKPVF